MKAAIIDKPGELVIRDIPRPVMGDYDVECEILFGATCTGTDLHLIDGVFPWPPTYPAILGHESIGRVIKVGPRVRNFHPGDLVTRVGVPTMPEHGLDSCWGGFAEYGIAKDHWTMRKDGLPPENWSNYRVNQVIPGDIDPGAATMLITWRETFSYLTRMGVSRDATVLVIGSGGNGLSFINHAANLGAKTIYMVGSATREKTARQAGANHYSDFRLNHWQQQVNQICPDGFDFVIDAIGKVTSSQVAIEHVRRGGKIGLYGIDDFGLAQINPFKARGPFSYYPNEYDEAEAHCAIVDFLLAGKLDASLWMDCLNPYPFERIGEAYLSVRRKEKIKNLVRIKEE